MKRGELEPRHRPTHPLPVVDLDRVELDRRPDIVLLDDGRPSLCLGLHCQQQLEGRRVLHLSDG